MAAPAIILDGTVINAADSATGWTGGSLDTDSEVQNTGCYGAKVSNATSPFTHSGATRDFSSGGTYEGQHLFVWLNCLTPTLDTLTNGGLRIRASNATDTGDWYVGGDGTVVGDPYSGGWKAFVQNPEADFDVIIGGTWTTGGNPAQLDDPTDFGGVVKTIATIMGNFNNGLIDAMIVGNGMRLEDGDGTTEGTFQAFIDADEGTKANRYGMCRSSSGVLFFQCKLFIGHDSGSATTLFDDADAVVVFEDAPVAATFYEISVEDFAGAADTDVTWGAIASGVTSGGNIIQAAGTTEWALTIDLQSGTSSFNAYACAFRRMRLLTVTNGGGVTLFQDCTWADSGQLDGGPTYTDCTFIGGTDVVQLQISSVAEMDDVSGCFFSSGDRAIEITVAGTYTFDGITFAGNTIDVRNSSAGLVTINVNPGGDTPTTENTGGGSIVVNNTVTVNVNCVDEDLVALNGVRVYVQDSSGPFDDSNQIVRESTAGAGLASDSFDYVSDTNVTVRCRLAGRFSVNQPAVITSTGLDVTVQMQTDPSYNL